MNMTPIPTQYSRVRFRSRLEARWAMFFDLVNLEWRYEHEGYQLRSGWYLPDFWLPQIQSFVEIKPPFDLQYAREEDRFQRARRLCMDLANESHKRVLVMSGDFGFWLPHWNEFLGSHHATCFFPDNGEDYGYLPCVCIECRQVGFEFEGRSSRICKHDADDRGHTADHHFLADAIERVNAHRFDYESCR